LNFTGSNSTDNAQGITWSWSGTTAQAGIYVQSSGSYGTKMYLATTDNFATGAKTAVSIDHVGNVSVTRGSLSVLNAITQNGNQVLHASNYSSYALPLSGGTLTGNVSIVNTNPVLVLRDSDNSGSGVGQTGYISFQDSTSTERAWIGYGSASSTDFNISNGRGQVTANGSIVVTAGNYNTYAPTLTGTGASGTWGISVSGNAATATLSVVQDTRAALISPQDYSNHRTTYEFTDKITGDWMSAITTHGWSGGSYATWQISGPASASAHENFYLRSGLNTTWNSLRTILHSGNYTSYALPLSGGTLSGQVILNAVGSAGSPSLRINTSSSTSFVHIQENLATNLTSGQTAVLVVGRDASAKNSGYIGYNWASAGSNSNYVSIGHWGSDHLLRIYGDGNVRGSQLTLGGSSTNTDANLGVEGTSHLTGTVYFGGTVGNVNSWSSLMSSSAGNEVHSVNSFVVNRTGYGGGNILEANSSGYVLAGGKFVADAWVHSARDFAVGTLITTSINYAGVAGDPFILEIRGNSYTDAVPYDIQYQGYIYSDTIISHGGYSNGTNISGLVALNVGGNLCFWFPRQSYWNGFYVRVYSALATYPRNTVTSITSTAKPSGTKEVGLSTNIRQSLHSGNYTSYSPTLTGGGAGGTWAINITGSAAAFGGYTSDLQTITASGDYLLVRNQASTKIQLATAASVASIVQGGASGTWAISVSGNAATATAASVGNVLRFSDGTGWLGGITAIGTSGSRSTDLAPNTYGQTIAAEFKNSGLYSFTGNFTGLVTIAPWLGTTASTGDPSYQLAFTPSAANSTTNPTLRLRAGIDTTWGAWNVLLHSNNYSSYALPLTGGTLTGSIKINTTGSSSNASHLILKRSGAAEPGSFGSYSGTWRSGIEVWNNDSTRMLFLNPPEADSLYSNIKSVGGGFFIDVGSSGGTRAIQIESTGAANFPVGLAHNGNAVLTTGNYSSYALPLSGGTITGATYFNTSAGPTSGSLSNASLQAYSTGNNAAYMSFHKAGNYAVNMGLDSDNVLRIGGWSAPANRWQLDMSGNGTYAGNVTAVDFNSTSDLRLKENIVALDGIELLADVNPVEFTWKTSGKKSYGVIAQELEQIMPELVAEATDGTKSVHYIPLIAMLVDAVKTLDARVKELETK
jgi:hypothetical protein